MATKIEKLNSIKNLFRVVFILNPRTYIYNQQLYFIPKINAHFLNAKPVTLEFYLLSIVLNSVIPIYKFIHLQ